MGSRPLWILPLAVLVVAGAAAQGNPVQITFGDCRDVDPIVSPDGSYLAFASDRTGDYNIYLLFFGKTGITQLTQGKQDDRFPGWSEDGRKIVFSSRRTGKGDIYETARDGSMGYMQLTAADTIDEHPSYGPRNAGLLYASGKGRLVARLRPQMNVVFADNANRAGNVRVLAEGAEPRFSPDGRRIVFVSDRTRNNDIWIMNADGSMQTQLTTDEKDDENPNFSPDGKRIVFASKRAGNFDIWVMDADGSHQRQITSSPADETQACWSSGGYLYYSAKTGEGHSNIFRVKAP